MQFADEAPDGWDSNFGRRLLWLCGMAKNQGRRRNGLGVLKHWFSFWEALRKRPDAPNAQFFGAIFARRLGSRACSNWICCRLHARKRAMNLAAPGANGAPSTGQNADLKSDIFQWLVSELAPGTAMQPNIRFVTQADVHSLSKPAPHAGKIVLYL